MEALPWCEYAPVPTHFGLTALDGREVYLSDPLEHYHSHIFVSQDARWLCGEGTHDASHLSVARFCRKTTRVEFIPLATVHTPYVPFVGQNVNAGFSADARWLIYNDTIDGCVQVCAAMVDI